MTTNDAQRTAPNEPLGLPRGSVRSLMSLGVVLGSGAIAGFLLAQDASSELTKIVIGSWVTALGNVIGFYFGTRERETRYT